MIGPAAFAALTWGAIALVAAIFCYEVYAVLAEYDIV